MGLQIYTSGVGSPGQPILRRLCLHETGLVYHRIQLSLISSPLLFPEVVLWLCCFQCTGDCAGAEPDLPWLLGAIKSYFKGHHKLNQAQFIYSLLLFSRENKEKERGKIKNWEKWPAAFPKTDQQLCQSNYQDKKVYKFKRNL
jgi:hypothetical protein